MRAIIATIVGLAALATTSSHAAVVPSGAQPLDRLHETPAENVKKSQWYDHLLSTNVSFRHYRTRKECGPIVNDRDLRNDCIKSFDAYEPLKPGYRHSR